MHSIKEMIMFNIFGKISNKRKEEAKPYTSNKFYTISGSSKKPVVSKQLVDFFQDRAENSEGFLYIGYPLIGTAEGAFAIDAMLVSRTYGLIAFDIVESNNLSEYELRQDEIYNKITSYLMQYSPLISKRKLVVDPKIITIAPRCDISHISNKKDYPVISDISDLEPILKNTNWENNTYYEQLHSVIQSITNIRNNRFKRNITKEDSRGAILRKLEDSIANLDHSQAEAVIKTYNGVQRIRGLAGSGKTIVLALKVAYLHSMNPDWHIAVTFNARSLKKQFEQLITRFVWDRKKEEPDWNKISILHAWGSSGSQLDKGIYYNACCNQGETYLNFSEASALFGYENAFKGACATLLKNHKGNIKPLYDAILIDEAQDFPCEFFQICYELLKTPKRLIYAYDELQSLNGNQMESPEVLFGTNYDGSPIVKRDQCDDIILYKCYRNSRPLLTTAHSFGFGIYREKGLVQMFENKKLWEDVGYEKTSGELNNNKDVVLERNEETSPKFLEELAPKDDLIIIKSFSNKEEQAQFLVDDIEKNLKEEDLLCSDIIVINSNPQTTINEVARARSLLYKKNINSNIAGVSTSPDIFQEQNAITFTGIFRAKGNEASMVYIINADECFENYNLAKMRNILFTAITRSKAWVRILGCGSAMDKLIEEYQKLKNNNYALEFTYPSIEDMAKMKLINRDVDKNTEKRIKNMNENLIDLIDALNSGEIYKEDLSPETLNKLKSLI